jgi:cysteinyl-tRNA synthetase
VIGVPELLGRHAVDEVRWFYASTHYRTKLAFSWELLAGASEGFRRVKRAVALMEARAGGAAGRGAALWACRVGYASLRAGDAGVPRERPGFTAGSFGAASERFIAAFMAAMDDDLATPSATAAIYAYVGELFAGGLETSEDLPGLLAAYRCLLRHLHVLGVELGSPRLYPELAAESMVTGAAGTDASAGYTAVIDRLVQARQEARARKDFARADLVRELLAGAGVVIEDTAKGPRWQMP